MTYDARYFILHSLGADPKYAPTGSVLASFRHTPPDSSVTHGGALRKDLSHLPLR